jgi:ferredoxin
MPKYKLIYDREACIGVAACEAVSKLLWKMNEDDNKADLLEAKKNEETGKWERIIETEEEIYDANESVAVCPVEIIQIEEIKE